MQESYLVQATEFARLFNVDPKNAYSELKKAADGLYEEEVVMHDKDKNKKVRLRWLYKATYLKGEGAVEIAFSPDVARYISQIERDYVMTRLYMYRSFKCAYSPRFYEFANRYLFRGEKYYSIEEFREMLGLTDRYLRWYDLKKNVLDPACEDVTTYTDRTLSYEAHKKGRSIVGITLFSFEKPQLIKKPNLSIDDENSELAPYQRKGYRSINEYMEADQLSTKHNVHFESATDYYEFKIKLQNSEAKTGDMFTVE